MTFDPKQHFSQFNFKDCKKVLVAVSGGSDSVGLLVSLDQYFQSLANAPTLHAVTVDHALRDGSAAEAEGVAALCETFNIPHTTLRWEGAKPSSAIQSIARRERRALLCQAAGECSASVIVTGHTLDDQMETVVMRQRRGSGPGLAGIADASLGFDDRGDGSPYWIVRPMLEVSRDQIRDYLRASNVTWIDDPSNENEAYERIAVRKELELISAAARSDLISKRNLTAHRRDELARTAGSYVQQFVEEVSPGLIHIDRKALDKSDRAALSVMLRALIAFAGGSANLGDMQVVEHIVEAILAYSSEKGTKPLRFTSNGALVEIRQSGIFMLREGRQTQRMHLPFDGRYRATGDLPIEKRSESRPVSSKIVPASLVRRAKDLEPVYRSEDEEMLLAHEAAQSGFPLRRLLNPWPDLVPLFDIELARKINVMVGGSSFPALPVYRYEKN